jgi:hypothetical protein
VVQLKPLSSVALVPQVVFHVLQQRLQFDLADAVRDRNFDEEPCTATTERIAWSSVQLRNVQQSQLNKRRCPPSSYSGCLAGFVERAYRGFDARLTCLLVN